MAYIIYLIYSFKKLNSKIIRTIRCWALYISFKNLGDSLLIW